MSCGSGELWASTNFCQGLIVKIGLILMLIVIKVLGRIYLVIASLSRRIRYFCQKASSPLCGVKSWKIRSKVASSDFGFIYEMKGSLSV